MDKVKSVFELDDVTDDVTDDAVERARAKAEYDDIFARAVLRYRHASLSQPRELDDEDLCVRDGYRDIVSMMREIQLAGRTLSAARAEQYDPEGVEEVDPTTRMDYDFFDAVDDAHRVSERLNAQEAAAKEAAAKEAAAKEAAAKEAAAKEAAVPAPEAPSSSAQ